MSAPKKPPTSAKPQPAQQQVPAGAKPAVTPAPTQATPNTPAQSEVTETTKSSKDNTKAALGAHWDEEAVTNSIMRGDHFQPNSANAYNNLAYHWRLFCMPDRDYAYEGGGIKTDIKDIYAALDAAPQIIIAETGATGYTIGEVNIKSVMGEVSSRGAIATDITMKISEPNGVSFLDALQQAARAAKVTNYLDFFYYLELTFKGYDTDGNIELTPFSELGNGGRWIWTVKINDIDVQLGSGGGTYKLSMIPMANHPMTAEYGTTIDTTTIKAETVGEFFEKLGEDMTESWKRRMFVGKKNDEGFITHKFKIHGIAGNGEAPPTVKEQQSADLNKILTTPIDMSTEGNQNKIDNSMTDEQKAVTSATLAANGISASTIAEMSLRPKEEDYSTVRGQLGFESTEESSAAGTSSSKDGAANSAGVPTATIGRGHRISDIIDMVMGTAEPLQRLARGSSADDKGADDEGNVSINPNGFRECVTWQCIPEVQFKPEGDYKYDYLTNRYGRTITWHIYPRVDQEPILSRLQIEQAFDGEKSRGVQKKMLSALAMRGFLPKRYDYLFTGLNTEVLNFDLGFNFAWSISLPRFESYYNSQNLPHALVDETKALLNYDQLDADRDAKLLEAQDAVKAAIDAEKNGTLDDEQRVETQQKRVDFYKAKNAALDAYAAGQAARTQAEERGKAALAQVPTEQDYQREFVENVLDNERKNSTQGKNSVIPRIPFSWGAGDQAKQDAGFGGAGQWHAGRQLYGAVLNQVYGPTTSRFMQVDMTIRGDPFWIGQGTYEDAIDHNKDVVDNVAQRPLAYNMMGQQSFLFRFKYPTDVDESGTIVLKDNETVTGIYKVTEVKSNFVGGQFTQDIHAVRLPLFNVFESILGVQDNADAAGDEAEKQGDAAPEQKSTTPAVQSPNVKPAPTPKPVPQATPKPPAKPAPRPATPPSRTPEDRARQSRIDGLTRLINSETAKRNPQIMADAKRELNKILYGRG